MTSPAVTHNPNVAVVSGLCNKISVSVSVSLFKFDNDLSIEVMSSFMMYEKQSDWHH
jgi:hypothetical protein